eukprot:GSChrysophyteH1.ASY1.ANO1.2821.1 assembled CDS
MISENGSTNSGNVDSIVLEEEIDPNYVPTENEIVEYAKWLGMDMEKDQDLYWVAKEGLMAPLPKNWKPCKTKDTEDIYYFNFSTGESTWDHPCDGYYKRLFEEEKKKKETTAKESSDQNRTQAKADVEQLLGKKDEKKKKKRKDAEQLGNAVAKKGDRKAAGKTAKTTLGPIGGSKPLEKKALPGIAAAPDGPAPANKSEPLAAEPIKVEPIKVEPFKAEPIKAEPFKAEPLRANSNTDLSVLTLSDSTGASVRDAALGPATTTRDDGLSVGTKRSKISMRLSSVVATSDENQLDSTPTKESGAKATLMAAPLVTAAGAKAEPRSALTEAKSGFRALEATVSAPMKSESPSKRHDHPGSQRREPAEAKPTSSLSLSSDSTGTGTAAPTYPEAALESKVAQLEKEVQKRETVIKSLELEREDAERRISRATQRQGVAEETEAVMSQKLGEFKEQIKQVRDSNEKLEKENKDLRSVLQKRREDVDMALDDDASKALVIESLQEELKAQQSSEARSIENQSALREELLTQAKFYETKIRSSDLALASSQEDVERQKRLVEDVRVQADEAAQHHASELDKQQKKIAGLQKELQEVQQTAQVVKEVSVGNSAEAAELDTAKKTVQRLTLELSVAKDAVDDAERRSRRFENMANSWENDFKNTETRLSATRIRANEFEDKCAELESENRALKATGKATALELETISVSAEKAAQAQRDAATLRVELATLQQERDAARAQLEIKSAKPEHEVIVDAELARVKQKLGDKDMEIATLNGENVVLKQRAEMLRQKHTILEAELENLHELHAALKDTHTRHMTASAEGSFEGPTPEELQVWKTRATKAEEEVSSLQVVVATADSERREVARALDAKTVETQQLKQQVFKAKELSKSLDEEKQLAIDELALLRASLTEHSMESQDMQEELLNLRRELLSKTSELTTAQFNLNAERRAREVQEAHKEVHNARHDVQTARLGEYEGTLAAHEATISKHEATITRLQNELSHTQSQLLQTHAQTRSQPESVNFVVAETAADRGIIELSTKVGQQSKAISSLEQKLRDAMDTIIRLKSEAVQAPPAPVEEELDKSLLIREMLQDFMQRRKPADAPADTLGSGPAPTPTTTRDRAHWVGVLQKETRFIADARRVLKEEKAAIRWEQQLLLKRREAWKSESQGRSSGTQQLLNQQTLALNASVEQARRTGDWLTERERKLNSLQQLADSPPSASTHEQLEKLAEELDGDMYSLTPGYHRFGNVPHGPGFLGAPAGFAAPSHLGQFYQSMGAQQSFFPVSIPYTSRNTYMEAQAESARPALRVTSENVRRTTTAESKQDFNKAAREVEKLAEEREQANAAYDAHINWLSGLRKDINTFQVQTDSENTRPAAERSGRAFINTVVHEKFEL